MRGYGHLDLNARQAAGNLGISMTDAGRDGGELVRLKTAQVALRDHFLKWQCRVRQHAVRQGGGRPSVPMRPYVLLHGVELAQLVVLINKKDPLPHTAEFRHMVLRTQDPAERYDSALKKLAAEYFQRHEEFSDHMTALFGPQSRLAGKLIDAGACVLAFRQSRQSYRIPCSVSRLPEHAPDFQATYWHNRLFNSAMPPGVQVLAFEPDWSTAEADPAPP
jgi:hypothetical protein